MRGDIHHLPWPLQPAELELENESLSAANGIKLPDTPPILHFAKEIDVVVWPLSSNVATNEG